MTLTGPVINPVEGSSGILKTKALTVTDTEQVHKLFRFGPDQFLDLGSGANLRGGVRKSSGAINAVQQTCQAYRC